MTRPIALVLAAILAAPLAVPTAAHAAPNVAAAFGNTVLIVDPDGRSRKIWMKPDGSWTGLSRRGLNLAGKWSVRGEEVCLSQSKPRLPGKLCHRFPATIGATLAARDPGGKTVQLRLVKGRITR